MQGNKLNQYQKMKKTSKWSKGLSKRTLKSTKMGTELIARASIDHMRQLKKKELNCKREEPKNNLRGFIPLRQLSSSNPTVLI